MAFATPQEIVEHFNSASTDAEKTQFMMYADHSFSTFQYIRDPVTGQTTVKAVNKGLPEVFTIQHAEEWLEKVKAVYMNNRMGKGLRPWEVVDVCASLDTNENWIGIEYETGYGTHEEYEKIIGWAWDNLLHSVVDAEGCGEYAAEITLAPVHVEDFMSDDYGIDKLLRFGSQEGITQDRSYDYYDDDNDDDEEPKIGMHCNISTPSFRTHKQYNAIGVLFARSLSALNTASKYELFGRIPYGSLCALATSRGHKYMEGKLFDSTDDINVWNRYKEVINRLADLIEHVSANFYDLFPDNTEGKAALNRARIDNFGDILRGRTSPEDLEILVSTVPPRLRSYNYY